MLKGLLLAFTAMLSFAEANSKILRVGIEYSDFSSAHNAAAAGDTLQIYGSHSGTATKRLVIIGFGYNFDVHPGLQAIGTNTPSQLSISFAVGSDSSVIEGIDGSVALFVSKVIIRRCNVTIHFYNNSNSINDIKVISSVFRGGGMVYNAHPCTNLLMYNCILGSSLSFGNTAGGAGSSGAIINCVSTPANYGITNLYLYGSNFLVKNCIIGVYNSGNANTVYESNFFGSSQPSSLPQGSNNRWGQSWTTIFNRLGGNSDNPSYYGDNAFDENYYILKIGSPAINGGTNAAGNPTDAGIFGGEPVYYYKLSGVPAVPSIYKLTAPTSAATTNPYNVTISVRSNN